MREADIIFAGNYEYIPEGEYEAIVKNYNFSEYYARKKLFLWFRLINNKYEETEIFMPFNMSKNMRRGAKYYEAWILANRGIKPKKNDRMSPKIFSNKVFKIKVRTVVSGSKQNKLSREDQYSVVNEILDVYVG